MYVRLTVYYERERIVKEWSVFEMTEKFSKREFVDKYPYIVYTGENDTSSDDLKVKSGSITSDDLANGAVTTGKIADGAVTAGKLADGAIPTASADILGGVKIGDGLSITEAGVLSASGGGDNVLIVNWTRTDATHQTVDHTAAEIVQAIEAGKIVIVKYTDNVVSAIPKPLYCYLSYKMPASEYSPANYAFTGSYTSQSNSKWQINLKTLMVDVNGTTFISGADISTITSA